MAKHRVIDTATPQFTVAYDGTNYAPFTCSATGDLTVAPTGGDTAITGNLAVSGTLAVSGAAMTYDGVTCARATFRETTTITVSGLATLTGAAWRYAMLEISCVGGTTSAVTPFVSKYLVRLQGVSTWAVGSSTLVSGTTLTITNVSGTTSSVTLTVTTPSLTDCSLSVIAHGWGNGTTLAFS